MQRTEVFRSPSRERVGPDEELARKETLPPAFSEPLVIFSLITPHLQAGIVDSSVLASLRESCERGVFALMGLKTIFHSKGIAGSSYERLC